VGTLAHGGGEETTRTIPSFIAHFHPEDGSKSAWCHYPEDHDLNVFASSLIHFFFLYFFLSFFSLFSIHRLFHGSFPPFFNPTFSHS
jgi:hypothetical protein